MTPYYDDGVVTLYHGDCRELLPALLIGGGPVVDAIVTDPPYGETKLGWDRWPDGWVAAVAAAVPSRAPMWCFGSMRMFLDRGHEFVAGGWRFAQDIVWEKHNGSGFAADRFKRVHEHAVQWYRGPWADVYVEPVTTMDATAGQVRRKKRPAHMGDVGRGSYESHDGGPRLARSVQRVRSCHGYAIHPTQKPVGIVEPLMRYSVPPGGLVLDPFAGSGTTLRVALDGGWRAIGIEADEQYLEPIAERLSQGALPFGSDS